MAQSLSVATALAEVPTPEGDEAPPAVETGAEPTSESDLAVVAAKTHYTSGMNAYRAGHFYDAARSFDAAHAALPRLVLLLNAGRAWEQARDLVRALSRFQSLRDHIDATDDLRDRADAGYHRVLEAMRHTSPEPSRAVGSPSTRAVSLLPAQADSETDSLLDWEWFGVRLFAGVYNITDSGGGMLWPSDTLPMLTGELVFFTMLWDGGYWDILRVGGGWPMVFTWGGSVGYRQRWGPHELRTGVHITSLIFPYPVSSGVEAIYLRRFESLNVEAGMRIHAFPTSLSGFVGMKF
jgi:hypothetical protein